jgi:hypothetical protein
MKFPNEKSSIEEIENFRPMGMFANWFWFGKKRELLQIKKNNLEKYLKV